MRKILVLVSCVLGFILIAAPTAVEYHQVFLNGKPFAKAVDLNGIIAISVEDLAKAGGGTLTLEEAGLQISGNTLNALVSSYSAEHKHKDASQLKIKYDQASTVPNADIKMSPAYKDNPAAAKIAIKGESHALFQVQRAGQVSTNLINFNGKKFVALSEVARAFGGTFTFTGNLKPGEAIKLNFAKNPNAILVGL